MSDDFSTLVDLLPGGVAQAFRLLEIGAVEADRFKGVSRELWAALQPPEDLAPLDPSVYRSHVRELLVRAEAGKALHLLTDAEVLVGLHQASLKAPLRASALALCYHLFRAVCGEAIALEVFGDDPPKPAYPDQVLEELAFMKGRPSPHPRPKRVEPITRKKTPHPLEDA